MASGVLEFDLSDPEDEKDFKKAVFASDMANFIWQLKHNTIRNAIRDEMNYADFVDMLYQEINDLPFDIDELIQ